MAGELGSEGIQKVFWHRAEVIHSRQGGCDCSQVGLDRSLGRDGILHGLVRAHGALGVHGHVLRADVRRHRAQIVGCGVCVPAGGEEIRVEEGVRLEEALLPVLEKLHQAGLFAHKVGPCIRAPFLLVPDCDEVVAAALGVSCDLTKASQLGFPVRAPYGVSSTLVSEGVDDVPDDPPVFRDALGLGDINGAKGVTDSVFPVALAEKVFAEVLPRVLYDAVEEFVIVIIKHLVLNSALLFHVGSLVAFLWTGGLFALIF
jgi:hypothetical protein